MTFGNFKFCEDRNSQTVNSTQIFSDKMSKHYASRTQLNVDSTPKKSTSLTLNKNHELSILDKKTPIENFENIRDIVDYTMTKGLDGKWITCKQPPKKENIFLKKRYGRRVKEKLRSFKSFKLEASAHQIQNNDEEMSEPGFTTRRNDEQPRIVLQRMKTVDPGFNEETNILFLTEQEDRLIMKGIERNKEHRLRKIT